MIVSSVLIDNCLYLTLRDDHKKMGESHTGLSLIITHIKYYNNYYVQLSFITYCISNTKDKYVNSLGIKTIHCTVRLSNHVTLHNLLIFHETLKLNDKGSLWQ